MMEQVSSVLGIPVQSSYVPAIAHAIATDRMTYYARFLNLLITSVNEYAFGVVRDYETQMFRKRYGYVLAFMPELGRSASNMRLVGGNSFLKIQLPADVFRAVWNRDTHKLPDHDRKYLPTVFILVSYHLDASLNEC